MANKLCTSHELRIGFQCNGSCKGPYTLLEIIASFWRENPSRDLKTELFVRTE